MDKARKTRRQKVEDRERAILTAAREVFIEHGFDGARIAEIGRRIGIAEGTVYLYFRTKSDLMAAVLDAFWDDLTHGARVVVSDIDDPTGQLRRLAEYHLDRLITEHAFLDLAAKLRPMSGRDPALHRHMRDYVRVFDEIWQRCADRSRTCRTAETWIVRDQFFGTLEYSARTVLQGGERGRADVVENLIGSMVQR